ncbi:MAG: hypothetical protein AAB390_00075 [Patescibacteria group bacterium]
MDGLISFGTIITWKSQHYIYLAEIGQITYLARIIEDENLKADFLGQYNRLEKASMSGGFRPQIALSNTIYCFVMLSTTDFEGDIALLHKLGRDTATVEEIANYSKLNEDDAGKLKKELIENTGIAKELQDYIKTLS